MKKEILFVLLKDFADWEGAYIAPNLNLGVEPGSESKYIVKNRICQERAGCIDRRVQGAARLWDP